ncbi:MAG: hypothetical protein ACJAVK_003748 [Akkermansiaceae bacterium]|jgi:hypothetical protein
MPGHTSDLVGGRERGVVVNPLKIGVGVFDGWGFNNGDVLGGFLAFRLDDANGQAIDEEDVVSGTGVGLVFAERLVKKNPWHVSRSAHSLTVRRKTEQLLL